MKNHNITRQEIVDYCRNEASVETAKRVEQWLEQSGAEQECEPLLRDIWDSMTPANDAVTRSRAFATFQSNVTTRRSLTRRRIVRWTRSIAACLFVPCMILSIYLTVNRSSDGRIELVERHVANGKTEQLSLPDGTNVWLNSGTSIIYPRKFAKHSRQVFITGEAFLEVKKDEASPFTVSVGGVDVKVLGTKFNVKSYANDSKVEVTLQEGAVAMTATNSSQTTILAPGDMVSYDKTTMLISHEKLLSDDYALWREGGIYFRNVTFHEIVLQLERLFNVEIVIRSPQLRGETYYVAFINNETLEQILGAFNADGRLDIKRNDNVIDISLK